MTQINWNYQVNNRAGGYIVTATDWNDIAGDLRALIDQTTGSGTTDNTPLPLGIDLVNDRVYISDPDSTTPEDGNHADTTLSVVGTTTLNGNTQQTGTFTVGVDDTGYDVKLFGATSGAYLLWDESEDDLVLAGAAGLDVAGDIDVDGTANLDAVDIDGAVQIDNTVTVGVDGSGWDVKLFGTTSGVYSLWDEDADEWTFVGADLDMDDNAVIRLGGGDDMLIYSSGAHSFIDHNGDGDLFIRTLGSGEDLYIQSADILNLRAGGSTTARLTITAAGLVGIGTTSPVLTGITIGRQPSHANEGGQINWEGGTGTATNMSIDRYDNDLRVLYDAAQVGTWSSTGKVTAYGGIHSAGQVTVGADTDGHDVKFFGNATGAYMLWDESTDDLVLGGAAQLGIGRTSPGYPLDIEAVNASTYARLRITHTYSSYSAAAWYIEGGANTYAGVFMGDNDDVDIGSMLYYNVDNSLRFTVNASERMRIDSSGDLTVGGNPYQKGIWTEWTPTITGTGYVLGNGTIVAYYAQFGKTVHFSFQFIMGSTSTWPTTFTFTGPVTEDANHRATFQTRMTQGGSGAIGAANFYAGDKRIYAYYQLADNGFIGSMSNTQPWTWATGGSFVCSGTYEAA